MWRAMGISIHTGWAACVVVSGSLREPQIHANEVIQILRDPERFCFHRASEMKQDEAAVWIASARKKAIDNARQALTTLVSRDVRACAIVANSEELRWNLAEIVASHSRIHKAEGCFYRDVLREAALAAWTTIRT
jgi:hypothetical protein